MPEAVSIARPCKSNSIIAVPSVGGDNATSLYTWLSEQEFENMQQQEELSGIQDWLDALQFPNTESYLSIRPPDRRKSLEYKNGEHSNTSTPILAHRGEPDVPGPPELKESIQGIATSEDFKVSEEALNEFMADVEGKEVFTDLLKWVAQSP